MTALGSNYTNSNERIKGGLAFDTITKFSHLNALCERVFYMDRENAFAKAKNKSGI